MMQDAFDLAERFQTPVFVLSDLDLGMNNWMADPFPYPTRPLDRGKVLDAEQLERIGKFERYRDVDGDGIPYRTLPGTNHPLASYFTRGSGHNEAAGYTEKPEDYVRLLDRISRKIHGAAAAVPQPIESGDSGTGIGIIAYGTSHWAIAESLDELRAHGVKAAYLRLRALPLNGKVKEFIDRHNRVYLVEQNEIGQMASIVKSEVAADVAKVRSVLHYDGMPLDAAFITRSILAQEKEL
jgi:2-oxoglutarate ferredoxin oxidoreductase subunit alpha